MGCLTCGRDLHSQCPSRSTSGICCGETSLCPDPSKDTHPRSTTPVPAASPAAQHASGEASATSQPDPNDSITALDFDLETEQDRGIGRPQKDSNFRDPESTGRKRAAELYPLDREADCEWRGKADCGGGHYPIVGCLDGKQSNRHHGPNKDTLDNRAGNVHRICARCHNLWHEWNDAASAANPVVPPSNPRPAEIEELVRWSDRRLRPKAPNSRFEWHRNRDKESDD